MSEVIRREEYRVPAYLVGDVDMTLDLDPSATLVTTRSVFNRNPRSDGTQPLVLDGDPGMDLVSVALGNRMLDVGEYRRDGGRLFLGDVPSGTAVEIVTRIAPDRNTAFEGLYLSNGTFCTQCEAEGFRRITFFPDRPDVMARFRVRLEADKSRQPVLLAGGNPVASGDLPGGRHYAVFDDPFPKSSYLFAAVGGDLDGIQDRFTTMSGREVRLCIFVDKGNAPGAWHAMRSLKAAMEWDERVYGREYQLDVFNIVAVNDFNMGAMENTGLNIFNSKYVLADVQTATDADYLGIESVIAHEYFHNWSGNRVTCRDWFQLSLKEGFTVFRDQEFSADRNNRTIARVAEVDNLRRSQFVEDAGPTAHPVRPDTYVEINNFYTATVYGKGAEVVRMQAALLGPDRFRPATDLYFARHDGQAVTCEDFTQAMEDASGIDLRQFRLWYSQAGTPVLKASGVHDGARQTYTLTFQQTVPATPGQPVKQAMAIPMRMGLLDTSGRDIPLTLEGETQPGATTRMLLLTRAEESFTFTGVAERPIASLLRDFSAPVVLEFPRSPGELVFLMRHDSDGFNQVDAARTLALQGLKTMLGEGAEPRFLPDFAEAARALLGEGRDPAILAEMLALPTKGILALGLPVIDIDGLTRVYDAARRQLGIALEDEWRTVYAANPSATPYDIAPQEIGKRRLKNLALSYLCAAGKGLELAQAQYDAADNMTDRLAALAILVRDGGAQGGTLDATLSATLASAALADFHARAQGNPLVIDKWFALQAGADLPHRVEAVRALTEHPDFTLANPNRARSVLGSFADGLSPSFHDASGSGYALFADLLQRLDKLNPQTSARMAGPLLQWQRYDPVRSGAMQAELKRLLDGTPSRNLREQVERSLAGA